MSAPKVHYRLWIVAPSESNPDGDELVLCGTGSAHKLTDQKSVTTCKNCLRELAKLNAERTTQ